MLVTATLAAADPMFHPIEALALFMKRQLGTHEPAGALPVAASGSEAP